MKFQIGKEGVTPGVIASLSLGFKTHKIIRISVLRGASPSKEKVREIADKIAKDLGGGFKYTIVGFTVIMRKSKMAVR